MQTPSEIRKGHQSREYPQPKGNWMQLTIAPLVEERLETSWYEESGSFVGTARRTGLADDDLAEPGQ